MSKKTPNNTTAPVGTPIQDIAAEALILSKSNEEAIAEVKADLKKGLEILTTALNNLQQRNRLR